MSEEEFWNKVFTPPYPCEGEGITFPEEDVCTTCCWQCSKLPKCVEKWRKDKSKWAENPWCEKGKEHKWCSASFKQYERLFGKKRGKKAVVQ